LEKTMKRLNGNSITSEASVQKTGQAAIIATR
jgi:hypothetical protein